MADTPFKRPTQLNTRTPLNAGDVVGTIGSLTAQEVLQAKRTKSTSRNLVIDSPQNHQTLDAHLTTSHANTPTTNLLMPTKHSPTAKHPKSQSPS